MFRAFHTHCCAACSDALTGCASSRQHILPSLLLLVIDHGFKVAILSRADVKNRRGNSARGRKITGMQFLPQDPSQLLITSNDSRVRLYEGKSFVVSYVAA